MAKLARSEKDKLKGRNVALFETDRKRRERKCCASIEKRSGGERSSATRSQRKPRWKRSRPKGKDGLMYRPLPNTSPALWGKKGKNPSPSRKERTREKKSLQKAREGKGRMKNSLNLGGRYVVKSGTPDLHSRSIYSLKKGEGGKISTSVSSQRRVETVGVRIKKKKRSIPANRSVMLERGLR